MNKILVVNSTSVRGYEGMTHEVIDFDGTLKEYVTSWLLEMMDEDDLDGQFSGEIHEEECFGLMEGGCEEYGYDYEGEEGCIYFSFL